MNNKVGFFNDFMFAFEFQSILRGMDPEYLIKKINEYFENIIDQDNTYIEIKDDYNKIATLPALYIADIIGPLARKIVRYRWEDRSKQVFISDMLQAVCTGTESVMLVSKYAIDISLGSLIGIMEKLHNNTFKEHLLIGIEMNVVEANGNNIKELKDLGIEYIQTEPTFNIDQLYKIIEIAHKHEMPLVAGVDYPCSLDTLGKFKERYGKAIPEEYFKVFDGINKEGVFVSAAIRNVASFINVCRELIAGVHIMAPPQHFRYFKDVIANGRGD